MAVQLIWFFILFLGFSSPYIVLVEKILRSMPDVDKIFLLMKAENKDAAIGRLMNEVCH